MDREFAGNIALMVAILMPMWICALVLMPSASEDDTIGYRISEESRKLRQSNRRLSNLTIWLSLIFATLTVVIIFLKT